jgi:hypothetical protein
MTIHQTTAQQATAVTTDYRPEPEDLFSSFQLGELKLANRTVMALMTRSRALEATSQIRLPRLITRNAHLPGCSSQKERSSPQGVGYIRRPASIRRSKLPVETVDAVHRAGGRFSRSYGMWAGCRIRISRWRATSRAFGPAGRW